MSNVQVTSATMRLLPVSCLCLLSCFGVSFSEETGPVVMMMVEEGSHVVLPCSFSTNLETKLFDWRKDSEKEVFLYDAGQHYNSGRSGQDEQFRGRVSHFKDQLKHGNASIAIRNTKVLDSGDYTCAFPRLRPGHLFHVKLLVGASPKPSVTALNGTSDWSLLQCEVLGAFPKPRVEWQDGSGNVLPSKQVQMTERAGSYDIILQTTVTKTDRYRCVSTQEEIHHQIYAETYEHISGPPAEPGASEPSVTTLDETSAWSLLQCVVKGASLKHKVEWQDGSGNAVPAKQPQITERAGSYDIIVQTTVTQSDRYRCVVTQEGNEQRAEAETYVNISGPPAEPDSHSRVIVAVVSVVVTLVVVGVLLYVKRWLEKKKKSDSPI